MALDEVLYFYPTIRTFKNYFFLYWWVTLRTSGLDSITLVHVSDPLHYQEHMHKLAVGFVVEVKFICAFHILTKAYVDKPKFHSFKELVANPLSLFVTYY